jgi:hypothetical protein
MGRRCSTSELVLREEAKMATLNLYVQIRARSHDSGPGAWEDGDWQDHLQSTLEGYMNKALKHPAIQGYDNAVLVCDAASPKGKTPSPDLVCYLLETENDSIIMGKIKNGKLKLPAQALADLKKEIASAAGGATTWIPNSGAISEVYAGRAEGESQLMANMVFHEWLHNTLEVSPSNPSINVHDIDKGVLSKPTIDSDAEPSPADLQSMNKGIRNKIQQDLE